MGCEHDAAITTQRHTRPMTPDPSPAPPLALPLPAGRWSTPDGGSSAGIRVGTRAVHIRGNVERFAARLVIALSGAATLTGRTPERRLFELRFDAHQVTSSNGALELDGLLMLNDDPTRVVARGSLQDDLAGRARLLLETVIDRRQLGLDWEELDEEVTLYADLRLRAEAAESMGSELEPPRD